MKFVGIALVYAYRYTIGALFPTSCKYHPSCSQYAIDALRRYGLVRGSILAGWRLLRCNPWSHGGVDRVPDEWSETLRETLLGRWTAAFRSSVRRRRRETVA